MSGPYLDARAERSLLVERRFQAREVFGQPCIRGELGGDVRGPGGELPFYMPEALRQRWPLFSRLSIRAIVELRHREDEGETHAHAAVALAVTYHERSGAPETERESPRNSQQSGRKILMSQNLVSDHCSSGDALDARAFSVDGELVPLFPRHADGSDRETPTSTSTR